ncbi:MAG: hypothetical protein PHE43_03395 [Candidatus Nanoarchaeia archaeon]|nr:hypothetical protein [Candidatus Nanoarchaeia archaeon]
MKVKPTIKIDIYEKTEFFHNWGYTLRSTNELLLSVYGSVIEGVCGGKKWNPFLQSCTRVNDMNCEGFRYYEMLFMKDLKREDLVGLLKSIEEQAQGSAKYHKIDHNIQRDYLNHPC